MAPARLSHGAPGAVALGTDQLDRTGMSGRRAIGRV